MPPGPDCLPYMVPIMAFRPKDNAWMGPDDEKPRVGTVVPVSQTHIHTIEFLRKVISNAASYDVKLTPVFSDHTYKDMMNGLHEFHELPSDPLLTRTMIRNHVAQYLTHLDLDLGFNSVNLFDHAVKNWKNYISILSDEQQRVFQQLKKIDHGIAAVEGCVASAKTLFGILVMLIVIAKVDPKTNKHKTALWLCETNASF